MKPILFTCAPGVRRRVRRAARKAGFALTSAKWGPRCDYLIQAISTTAFTHVHASSTADNLNKVDIFVAQLQLPSRSSLG